MKLSCFYMDLKKILTIAILSFAILFAGCSAPQNTMVQNQTGNESEQNESTKNMAQEENSVNEKTENTISNNMMSNGYKCEFTEKNNTNNTMNYYQKGTMLRIDNSENDSVAMVIKDNRSYIYLDEEGKQNLAEMGMQDCDWMYFDGSSSMAEGMLENFDLNLEMIEKMQDEQDVDTFDHDCVESELSEDFFKIEGNTCDFAAIIENMMQQFEQQYANMNISADAYEEYN